MKKISLKIVICNISDLVTIQISVGPITEMSGVFTFHFSLENCVIGKITGFQITVSE